MGGGGCCGQTLPALFQNMSFPTQVPLVLIFSFSDYFILFFPLIQEDYRAGDPGPRKEECPCFMTGQKEERKGVRTFLWDGLLLLL